MRTKKKADSSKDGAIVGCEKAASGAEHWSVRTSDGRIETRTTKASSAAAMDRTEKRYAGLLERLAKR